MATRAQRLTFPKRFSDFRPETRLSDDDFKRIEAAGQVRLDRRRRAAIQRRLQEFEYLTGYEESGAAEVRKSELTRLNFHLAEIIKIARAMDSLPGHLWSYLTDHAGVNADMELVRLKRVHIEGAKLAKKIDRVRAKKSSNPLLPGLLLQLEREFKLANGGSTGVSNWKGQRRGRFVDFCNAATRALPKRCRPMTVGSTWEVIDSERKRQKGRKSTFRIWVGKAHPFLVKY